VNVERPESKGLAVGEVAALDKIDTFFLIKVEPLGVLVKDDLFVVVHFVVNVALLVLAVDLFGVQDFGHAD